MYNSVEKQCKLAKIFAMDKSTIFRLVKNKIDGKIWKLTGKIGSKKLIDERGDRILIPTNSV